MRTFPALNLAKARDITAKAMPAATIRAAEADALNPGSMSRPPCPWRRKNKSRKEKTMKLKLYLLITDDDNGNQSEIVTTRAGAPRPAA